jgi:tetratricopeptide (TPR) repeat protein
MLETAQVLLQQAARARLERRLDDAHRDYSSAVAVSRQVSARLELLHALKGLGQIERDLGHSELARPLIEEAVELCRSESDPLLLAHTIRHLGDLHQDTGNLDLAEPCYQEALAIYRNDKQTAPLDLANTIRPLALLKESIGAMDDAVPLWKEARDLYSAVNVQAGVAECEKHLKARRIT